MAWGLVATIKAPADDILRFAAYHLQAGAQRLFIYLDAPSDAYEALHAHPKICVTLCDEAYWQSRGRNRPPKHQSRQTMNANHAYGRASDVDWIIHMDVDEFLVAEAPIDAVLCGLPDTVTVVRVRPMELLSDSTDLFKAFIPAGPERERIVAALYPTYGPHLKGGFLSHLAGKIFVRTGVPGLKLRIHNAFQGNEMIKAEVDQPNVQLAHCHAKTWGDWQRHFRYRHASGSYRADLGPARARDRGGITMHELFNMIQRENGTEGLRAFYDEVCTATPQLCTRLEEHGLLRRVALDLDTKVAHHFPDATSV